MPVYIDGEPTQEEWEFINEFKRAEMEIEEMKDTVRLEIRLSRTLKERLEREAKCCEESMNAYLLMIIGHRKRVRVNLPTEGGQYLGY